MVSPARLMEAISGVTGIALPTIVDIDRKLVQAGLRPKGGRGFNVVRMGPLDAARLLTAILASQHSTGAAAAAVRYGQTRVERERSSDNLFGSAELDDLAALPASHSFIDALAALIASAATGSLAKLAAALLNGQMPDIAVYAFMKATGGRIRIAGLPNKLTASVEYVSASRAATGHADYGSRSTSITSDDSLGDMEQSRRIKQRTIFAVAALFAEEDRHERG